MSIMKATLALCLPLAIVTSAFAQEQTPGPFLNSDQAYERMTPYAAKETEAYALGVQTVMWGMQFVKASAALRLFASPLPAGQPRSPVDPSPHALNVFGHARQTLTHEIRTVERPNSETPYSAAVVDLIDGPVVLVHPDHKGRYFRTSVWDTYGETRTISQKQDGDEPPPYLLAPHDWMGEVPNGMKRISFRSRLVLLAPHIALVAIENDIKNVHALQDQYKLIALEDWGSTNAELPAEAVKGTVRPLVRPGTKTPTELLFFEMLGEALKDITLYEDEVAFARQLQRIGLSVDGGFDYASLSPAAVAGLQRAVLDGQSLLEHKGRNVSPVQPGGTWMVGTDITTVADWLRRGVAGWKWVWGDLYSEIIYPMAERDADGEDFDGSEKYEIRFPKGELPPARYWRITLYDMDGYLAANPIKRYGVGNMAEELSVAADGSVTVYVQHESPGKDKEANWLPTPDAGFVLMMRMYQPEQRMYSGDYIVPPVVRR